MAVTLRVMAEILRDGLRQVEQDVMTAYRTLGTSAGLGYNSGGLGGQSTAAQPFSVSIADYRDAPPHIQRAISQLQVDGHAQYDPAVDRIIFGSSDNANVAIVQRSVSLFREQQAQRVQMQAQMLEAQQRTQQAQALQNHPYVVGSSAAIGNAGYTWAQATIMPSTDAMTRSMELLYDWLNPDQRRQLATRGFFDAIGGTSGARYRLYSPCNFNVHRLQKDSENLEYRLCFQPKDTTLPKGDIWLTQKLALELDEDNTLALATKSATNPPL